MPALLLALLSAATIAARADTTRYVVLNHGRNAGEMVVIAEGDSVLVRYYHVDRNRGPRSETRYRLASDGTVTFAEAHPLRLDGQPNGAVERVEVSADSVRWAATPPGAAPTERGEWFRLQNSTPFDEAILARHLLKQPGHSAKLLPSGRARADIVADTTIRTTRGPLHVRFVAVQYSDYGNTGIGVWLDDRGALVASAADWFITVRPDAQAALPALRAKELTYRRREGDTLARKLNATPHDMLVIRNGNLFDADAGVMRARTSVVIRGDRITAVGPADSVATPPGATVIDATGKTVMPGMWEMHAHDQITSQTSGAPMQLARGITTSRDMAADIDVAVSDRDRAAAGKIVSPRMILAGFMEGPLAWAGPTGVLVRNEAEARVWVAKYDSLGYKQFKLYNDVHPDLVPVIAAEAHKRGMRLSGHIPRGLSVPAAVLLGFDEVNHAAFLFSTFFQDSLYVPKMRAYSAVASAVASNIDVDGAPMTELINFLKAHNTVIDGTFSVWIRGAGTGLAQQVGAGVSSDAQKADSNYMRLIKRLFDAGVTLVPGTDAFGSSSYNTELEIYEKSGVPAPAVLQMATIVSARVMKEDREYGSIVPGKVADLIVVNGQPAEHVSDARKVTLVVRGGRVFEPNAILAAIGLPAR
jgi:imidazolonepropionase-like amidohydrolase